NMLDIHFSKINGTTKEITSDGQCIDKNNSSFQYIDENILKNSNLHCNHYPLQSFDWFKKIKMTRGSASSKQNDKIRSIDYYNAFDSHSNQLIDNELLCK